jgi:hypothetical protein
MDSNTPLSSSRIRKPSTGRRNINDGLLIPQFPPILPRNEDPTIPPASERKQRVLSCPKTWVESNQSPAWLEGASVGVNYDSQAKEAYTRAFIERNQDQMWKYDPKFRNMSPRSIRDEIMSSGGFVTRMRQYKVKEQSIPLTTSRHVSEVLHGNRYGTSTYLDTADKDPYLASTNTSRTERELRTSHLFTPNFYQGINTIHRKGYNHAPEYGNFSRFCGVLKSNEGATLKR